MSLMKMLRELDRKFSWSFFGFLLAILLGLFTLYDRFLAEKSPQIYFDVLTSASVLDIKENIPKLDISFEGIAIKEQKLSLRILSIKVINDSSQDILKNHYDSDDPVGLKVTSGKIIRAELTDASNEYLKRNLSFGTPSTNTIHFKNVIFEAHQYGVVKILVLHPVEQTPSVMPVGHIAGMKQIIVREPYKERAKVSFWSQTFAGTWGVQGVRLITYSILTVLCILLVVIPVSLIGGYAEKIKRKGHVRNFKAVTSLNLNENDEFIFSRYIEKGVEELFEIQTLIGSDKNLAEAHDHHIKAEKGVSTHTDYPEIVIGHALANVRVLQFNYSDVIFKALLDSGFVKDDGGTISVDAHMKATIEHFIRYLKNTGIIPTEEMKVKQHLKMPSRELDSAGKDQTNPPDRSKK